ncbi:hypothetical protein NDA14_007824 [Ustilago hordei]|nr:hypothetical protein NDA14_007824 [Ustilago hordei]
MYLKCSGHLQQRQPFGLLRTFGCLAWVHLPKAKRKKLDDTAIPAIFIGYDEEHKGWKFISNQHNPPIFWSDTARFLENKSWQDCMETQPLQEIDTIQHDNSEDVEDLRYTNEDIHDEQLQRQINHIYRPDKDGTQGIPQPTKSDEIQEGLVDDRIKSAQKVYP